MDESAQGLAQEIGPFCSVSSEGGASKLWLKENLAEPEASTVGRGVAEAIPNDPLAAASFLGCQSVLFAFLL